MINGITKSTTITPHEAKEIENTLIDVIEDSLCFDGMLRGAWWDKLDLLQRGGYSVACMRVKQEQQSFKDRVMDWEFQMFLIRDYQRSFKLGGSRGGSNRKKSTD